MAMETFNEFWQTITEFLGKSIFSQGSSNLSLGMLLYIVVGLFLVFFLSKLISRLVVVKLLNRYGTDKGVSHAVGTIFVTTQESFLAVINN